jgi:hypothetical protein
MVYFYAVAYHLRQRTADLRFNGLPHLKCISMYLGVLKGLCSYFTARDCSKRRLRQAAFLRYLRRHVFTFTPSHPKKCNGSWLAIYSNLFKNLHKKTVWKPGLKWNGVPLQSW